MSKVKQTRMKRQLEEKEKESDMFRASSFMKCFPINKFKIIIALINELFKFIITETD